MTTTEEKLKVKKGDIVALARRSSVTYAIGLRRGTESSTYFRLMRVGSASRDGDANGEHATDRHPSYRAAKVLGWPYSEKHGRGAIRVSGCGMDMCFHTVSTLSEIIHGDGTALRYRSL